MATIVVRLHFVWSAVRCCVLKAIAAKRTWEVTKWALVLHMRRSVVQGLACFYACVNVRYCWWPIRTKDVFTLLLIWMRTARQIKDWGNIAYLFRARSLYLFQRNKREGNSVSIGNSMICSDISKLWYVISRAVRRVKFETILKYHEWYLCQISRTNHAINYLHYYP